jgi:hypothetical protein
MMRRKSGEETQDFHCLLVAKKLLDQNHAGIVARKAKRIKAKNDCWDIEGIERKFQVSLDQF